MSQHPSSFPDPLPVPTASCCAPGPRALLHAGWRFCKAATYFVLTKTLVHHRNAAPVGWSCPGEQHFTHRSESGALCCRLPRAWGRTGVGGALRARGRAESSRLCPSVPASKSVLQVPRGWDERQEQTRERVPQPSSPLPGRQVDWQHGRGWSNTLKTCVQTVPCL